MAWRPCAAMKTRSSRWNQLASPACPRYPCRATLNLKKIYFFATQHLRDPWALARIPPLPARGAIAQLGERLHGMQEVGGSIPPGSTNYPGIRPIQGRE